MANNELTIELIRQVVKEEVNQGLNGAMSSLRAEMHQGFEQVLATIDAHKLETDKKFTSDRRRIERLEKAVIF